MEPLSFKTTSGRFLLCVFLSLLWVVTDANTTTPVTTPTASVTTPTASVTTPTASVTTPTASVTTPTASVTTPTTRVTTPTTRVTTPTTRVTTPTTRVTTPTTRVTTPTASVTTPTTLEMTTIPSTTLRPKILPPPNAENFKSVAQNETSITLQWKNVNDSLNYKLLFSGGEKNVSPSAGQELVTTTITGLTNMTEYNFTLFTLNENVSSSGVSITAFTAPPHAEDFKSVAQNETSITLQWKNVKNIHNYTLLFSGGEINVTASAGEEPVTQLITGLTNMTEYNFTLFTVFGNIESSRVNIIAFTAPPNAEDFKSVAQNETSITLQWKNVNDSLNYTLLFIGGEIHVNASAGQELVSHTITGLTNMTKYNFTLFTVFENIKSSGVSITAFTAPPNAEDFKSVAQNETSITLQWKRVKNILNYKLLFSGREIHVNASVGQELVTYTILELTSGTRYSFTLFTVYESIESSGVSIIAFTAPPNAEDFKSVAQNETSITLQWKNVNDSLNYTLLFIGGEIHVNASAGQELVSYTITGLTNMTEYNFTLFTVFENIKSSGVSITAFTAPPNAEDFKSVAQNETSITLQWKNVNDFLNYTLLFIGGEIHVNASAGQELVSHTIPGLTNMTEYNFTLFTVFENIKSSGVSITAFTAPPNAEDFKSVAQNETSITLQWKNVKNILNYTLLFSGGEKNVNASAGQELVTYTIVELTSGTLYNFTLVTVFEKVRSSGVNHDAPTVPLMVISVDNTQRSVTSITLTWTIVNEDWYYFLQINEEISQINPNRDLDVVSHTITPLQPGTKYPFSLITGFSGLNSTAYEDYTVTAIDCTKGTWRVTNSSIQGMIEGVFSSATATNKTQTHVSPGGGNVSFAGLYPGATYDVSLVYETKSTTWIQCSHNVTIIPAYLSADCEYVAAGYSVSIVWNKPEGVWTSVEVNATGETHTVHGNDEQRLQISGFQPAQTYEVSLALLSGTVRSHEPFVFSCLTDPRGVIAGAVFAVVIFCLLLCLALFIFFKRPDIFRKKPFIGGSRQSNKKCKAISVATFPDHFYQLGVDENKGFSEEYESLIPVGTEQMRGAALLPQNKARNRFNNVLPYDWCRVKLTTSNPNESSDYINACYMPGYKSNREYIATQGPLPSTVNDFWRMIWEQRVKGIVMVTNCTEGGRTKCERYWPADTKPCSFGEMLVTSRSEQQEPNWTLREFRVKHGNTSEERTVRHFHFTAWPDHGVPQGTEVLIQFRELLRQHIESEGAKAPTVVHCSAGVGRTGTIIALDVLLQQLEKESAVGINGFVHKMRLSRPHMVQTESQYVFLHQCIMDRLRANEKTEENIYENADMIYANATALREFTKA